MCQQISTRCRNRKCTGVAHIWEVIPCENRPNCTLTHKYVGKKKGATEIYCESCKQSTPDERRRQMSKEWHAKATQRVKAEASNADSGQVGTQGGSGQQAQSSARGSRSSVSAFLNSTISSFTGGQPDRWMMLPDSDNFIRSDVYSQLQHQHRASGAPGSFRDFLLNNHTRETTTTSPTGGNSASASAYLPPYTGNTLLTRAELQNYRHGDAAESLLSLVQSPRVFPTPQPGSDPGTNAPTTGNPDAPSSARHGARDHHPASESDVTRRDGRMR